MLLGQLQTQTKITETFKGEFSTCIPKTQIGCSLGHLDPRHFVWWITVPKTQYCTCLHQKTLCKMDVLQYNNIEVSRYWPFPTLCSWKEILFLSHYNTGSSYSVRKILTTHKKWGINRGGPIEAGWGVWQGVPIFICPLVFTSPSSPNPWIRKGRQERNRRIVMGRRILG